MMNGGGGPVDLSSLEALNRAQEAQMALVPTKGESLRATAIQLACGLISSGHWRRSQDEIVNDATPNDVIVLAERLTRYIETGSVKVQ